MWKFVTLGALVLALPAAARDGAARTGPNGGPVVVADGHPVEMVTSETQIVFHIQDEDGTPLDTAGTSGRAIVTQAGKNMTVRLAASPPNKLAGPLAAPLAAGAKVVLSARLHGHDLQARFETK